MKKKVVVLGSGNWGTTVAKIIAENLTSKPELQDYEKNLEMYVYEEILADNGKLSEFINKYRQNIKYLPDVILPDNVIAVPDIKKVVKDATDLILVSPHQFAARMLSEIKEVLIPDRKNIFLINLSKGLHYDPIEKKLWRVSEIARKILNIPEENIAALSGPNVAKEIAKEYFTETCIASKSIDTVNRFKLLFEKPFFVVRASNDVAGLEFGGALKNIVAIAAGLIDGFGLGSNAKATLIRIGMEEMYKFANLSVFAGAELSRETFNGPAFLGDIMTTCYGGRNRQFGETLGICFKHGLPPVSVEVFQQTVLKGQILQGYETVIDVISFIENCADIGEFPLFKLVHNVVKKGMNPQNEFLKLLKN